MTEPYAPTTDEVRVGYVVHTSQVEPHAEVPDIADGFDAWLAAHDREVREQVPARSHDPRCISLTDSEFNGSCDCRVWIAIDLGRTTVKPDRETVAAHIEGDLPGFRFAYAERAADAVLASWPGKTEAEVREQVAQEIEAAYLEPDSGRNPMTGADPSDANERHAYDEGLEQAARIARGEQP